MHELLQRYSKEQLTAALNRLGELSRGDNLPRYYGICRAISQVVHGRVDYDTKFMDWFKIAIKKWPDNSGEEGYPIPSGHHDMTSGRYYHLHMEDPDIWQGRQLEYRKSLCAHLVRCLLEDM